MKDLAYIVDRPTRKIKSIWKNILWAAATISIALLSYAVLTADIRLSLWPHTQFFSLLYGMEFTFDPALGYVERGGLFSITEGCMGVKLFVSAFLLAALGFGLRRESTTGRLRFMLAAYFLSLAGAFGMTLLRISLSLPFCGTEDAQLTHNAISLFIYFGSMIGLYCFLQHKFGRAGASPTPHEQTEG